MPLSCSSVTEETPRCPVAQAEHTAWSLFRHADVSRALLDPATYSSAVSAHLAVPSGIDTPEHTDYRLIIDRYFAPDRMAAVEPKLRAIAVEMLGAARSVPWMTLSGMRDGVDVVGDRKGVDQVGRTGRLALSAGRERLTFDATEPR